MRSIEVEFERVVWASFIFYRYVLVCQKGYARGNMYELAR